MGGQDRRGGRDHDGGVVTDMHLHRAVDVPLVDLLRFWSWLADQVPTAPEFRDLSDANKAALATLLRATPTRYGPH